MNIASLRLYVLKIDERTYLISLHNAIKNCFDDNSGCGGDPE